VRTSERLSQLLTALVVLNPLIALKAHPTILPRARHRTDRRQTGFVRL
jgi:hypothetical protein